MRENERGGKVPTQKNVSFIQKLRSPLQSLVGAYILPKIDKITKMYELPTIT